MYLQKKLTLISLARTWDCGETQSLLRSFFTYSARACSTASTGLSLELHRQQIGACSGDLAALKPAVSFTW